MSRVKTFDSTGVAPNGKLFAGDLNSIQDQYADIFNLLQAFGASTLTVGESGLQIVRFGTGEARLTGAFRTDGIIRALGGLYFGAYTTAQRDAIPSAQAPYGLTILNTSTNRLEINLNSSGGTPSWQPLAGTNVARGAFGAIPTPSLANANTFYFATDQNGGTLYFSDGSTWTKIAPGLTEPKIPIDGSVSTVKILDGAVTQQKAAAGAFAGQSYDVAFPTTGLYNGYRFTLFLTNPAGGMAAGDFIYRTDLDSTYPWHFVGGSPLHSDAAPASTGSGTDVDVGPAISVPRNGVWRPEWKVSRSIGQQNNGTNAIISLVAAGVVRATVKGDYDSDLGGGSYSTQVTLASGQTATYYLRSSTAGNGVTVDERSIDLWPVKLS